MDKSYLIQLILQDYLDRTPHPQNEVKFLQEFNNLTPKERFEFLTTSDGVLNDGTLDMVKFAIKNAGGRHTFTDGKNVPEQQIGEIGGVKYQVIYDHSINWFYLQFQKEDSSFYEEEFVFPERSVHPTAIEAAKNVVLFLVGAKRRETK